MRETFIDAEGVEHTIIGYCNHGAGINYMITKIEHKEEGWIDSFILPQLWENNSLEEPIWIMKPLNLHFTVADILVNTMVGPVGDLNEYDFRDGKFNS